MIPDWDPQSEVQRLGQQWIGKKWVVLFVFWVLWCLGWGLVEAFWLAFFLVWVLVAHF